jgi:diguanylate cyclase (GGDEF)-like protein
MAETGETPTPDPYPPQDELLARERRRVVYSISILAVAFLVPFVVYDLFRARVLLALSIATVVVAFAADGYAVLRRRGPLVRYPLLLLPIATAISLAVITLGVVGAFWCYPAVLFFYFVLDRNMARLCSGTLLLVAAAVLHTQPSVGVTIRFGASLILTIFIIDTIQGIIGGLQRRLVEQAIRDPLTGAFNRRHMDVRLDEALETFRRRQTPAALLLIDVDHFKHINDTHGHKAGDRVLKGIVGLVRQRSRKVDHVFRLGGEEFVLLLPGTPETDAVAVAEDIRQAIERSRLVDGTAVTASIGVRGLERQDSIEPWIKEADTAMYAAKLAGRNRVVRGTSSPAQDGAAVEAPVTRGAPPAVPPSIRNVL